MPLLHAFAQPLVSMCNRAWCTFVDRTRAVQSDGEEEGRLHRATLGGFRWRSVSTPNITESSPATVAASDADASIAVAVSIPKDSANGLTDGDIAFISAVFIATDTADEFPASVCPPTSGAAHLLPSQHVVAPVLSWDGTTSSAIYCLPRALL